MRSFKFRLEAFLRIRSHVEKTWELKLAEATGACVLLEGKIHDLNREMSSASACSVDGILYGIHELYARNEYRKRLDKDLEEARLLLATKRKEREETNRRYIDASRDRKDLDKLKERRSAEYYKKELSEEDKAVDEIATNMKRGKAWHSTAE
jgi:flagellar FliJ protein